MTDLETKKPQGASLEMVARNGSPLRRIAARIPTYWADIRENPAWFPMFLLARTMPARRAHWLGAKAVRRQKNAGPSMFSGVDRDKTVETLRTSGLFSGLVLPDAVHEAISSFARQTPCFGNFDRRLEFLPEEHAEAEQRFDRSILSGHYFERALQCEAIVALQRDPLLHDIAAHYLGGQSKLITTRIWWSFPTNRLRRPT